MSMWYMHMYSISMHSIIVQEGSSTAHILGEYIVYKVTELTTGYIPAALDCGYGDVGMRPVPDINKSDHSKYMYLAQALPHSMQ